MLFFGQPNARPTGWETEQDSLFSAHLTDGTQNSGDVGARTGRQYAITDNQIALRGSLMRGAPSILTYSSLRLTLIHL